MAGAIFGLNSLTLSKFLIDACMYLIQFNYFIYDTKANFLINRINLIL